MERLKTAVQTVKSAFKETNSEYLGIVSGIGLSRRPQAGPRSRIVNIIRNGYGDCATTDAIQDYTAFPYSTSEPYINELKESGVLEERVISRPKTGEEVTLICISDYGKSAQGNPSDQEAR